MNEEDLRDCFAMFAIMKMAWEPGKDTENARDCYAIADALLEARKKEPETGIVAVKRSSTKKEK